MDTEDRIALPKPVAGDLRIHKVYAPPKEWVEIALRARLAGMSVSAYFRTLAARDELDADGKPAWAASGSSQPSLMEMGTAAA
jgi:hypothetical protein